MQHVSIPGLRVPRNISMNSGPKWAELVSPFSDVGKQLRAYRQAQDDYFSGQGTEECLTAEARAYSKQLSSLFGEKQSESAIARVAIGVAFSLRAGGGSRSSGSPLADRKLLVSDNNA